MTLPALALWVFAGSAAAAPALDTVTIDGFVFKPAVVTVNRGDRVVWKNADLVPHTATAGDAGLDSGPIVTGATFTFTATRKGRFGYICTLHPSMKGEIVVR